MKQTNIALLHFLALLAIGVSAPSYRPSGSVSCPSAEDLYPCKCNRVAYGLHVTCENFADSSFLVKAFKVLRDHDVQNVILHGLKLDDVLPSDLFDGLVIRTLRVEKCSLKFAEPAFSGLDDSLNTLNVAKHSMIKSSDTFLIARLNKLEELNIKLNPLRTVKNTWLNGKIPNVQKIVMDADDIEEIENKAFAELKNIRSISMSANKINKVERSMFPRPAKNLTRIDLSGNAIRSIPYDFFFEMPQLEDVILSDNKITSLPENTWKTVWEQLNTVSLVGNALVCDKNLEWIRNLRFPDNVLGACSSPQDQMGKSLKEFFNKT